MIAKPMETLELHYLVIQIFLIWSSGYNNL